jgi:hypothetical protein
MKQTAVEWLEEQYNLGNGFEKLLTIEQFEKAKEMEIEQLKNAWDSSDINMRNQFSSSAYKAITFDQWLEQFKTK